MNESGPSFYAWCDEAERIEAFGSALFALVSPEVVCSLSVVTLGSDERTRHYNATASEVITIVRASFKAGTEVRVRFGDRWRHFCRVGGLALECYGEEYDRRYPNGPLRVPTNQRKDMYPDCLEIATTSTMHTVEVTAAICAMYVQQEMEEILLALCCPDASARVTTGACVAGNMWSAPVEAGATYNADGRVARDLALTWLHLHDGDLVGRASRLSLHDLTARVAAAPPRAQVGIAHDVNRSYEHALLDLDNGRMKGERRSDAVRNGPRTHLAGDIPLTREQVLDVLATPPEVLLEALEAAAVADDEWRAVESQALEMIEAQKMGAPTYVVDVTTGKHTRFIERHAPYHVRRLPNGGVMLATHPYRTLWPLYQDALLLLGITS